MSLHVNIEKKTLSNASYRKVIYTDKHQQLVLMSLNVGEYLPRESHKGTQFFRIEQGSGIAVIKSKRVRLTDGTILMIPPNTKHMLKNTSARYPLKLYSIYSPPQHPRETIHRRQKNDPEFKQHAF